MLASSVSRNAAMEVTIEALTSKQRSHLKRMAHELKPVLHIGKSGVTDSTVEAVQDALSTRELLKVKVLDIAPDGALETGDALVKLLDDTHLVQVIGRTLILYRPDPEQPEIRLPR
jgi:RNA-binding protein